MTISQYRETLSETWGFDDGNGNLMEFCSAQAAKLEASWSAAVLQLKRSRLMQCKVYEKQVKVKIDLDSLPTCHFIPVMVHMRWKVGESVYFPELKWRKEEGTGPEHKVYRFLHDPTYKWKCPGCEYNNLEDFPVCLLCSTAKPDTPTNLRKQSVIRMMAQAVISQQIITMDDMNLDLSGSSIARRLAIAHNLLSSRDFAINQWRYGDAQIDMGYEQFLADALEAVWTVVMPPDRQEEIVHRIRQSRAPSDTDECTCCKCEWTNPAFLETTTIEVRKPWFNCIKDVVIPYPFQPIEGGCINRPLYNAWDNTECQVYKQDQQHPDDPEKNFPRCKAGHRHNECLKCKWSDWKPHLPENVTRQTCMVCTCMGMCKMTHEEILPWPKSLHHVEDGAVLLPSTLMSLYQDDKCNFLWAPEDGQQQADMPLKKAPHKHLVSIVRILVRAAISAHNHWHECPECQYGFFHKKDSSTLVDEDDGTTVISCPHCTNMFKDRFEVFNALGLKEFEVHINGINEHSQFVKICRRCKNKSITRPPPATCSLRSCHVCGNWQNYTSNDSHLYKDKLYEKSRKAKNVWERDQFMAKNRMSTSELEAHNNRFIVGGHNKRHKPGHSVPGGQDTKKTW